jgi:nucleoid-associated protein YgaU
MARETKVGLVLVVVLACGFGLLLYKRLQHPTISVAQATEGGADGAVDTDDIAAEIKLASAANESSTTTSAITSAQPAGSNAAKALSPALEDDLLSLAGTGMTPPPANSTPAPVKPPLPTLPTDLDALTFPGNDEPAPGSATASKSPTNQAAPAEDLDPFGGMAATASAQANAAPTASTQSTSAASDDPFAGEFGGSPSAGMSGAANTARAAVSAGNGPTGNGSTGNGLPAGDDPFGVELKLDQTEPPSQSASLPAATSSRMAATQPAAEADPFDLPREEASEPKKSLDPPSAALAMSIAEAVESRSRAATPSTPTAPAGQDDPFAMPVEVSSKEVASAIDRQAEVVESLELPVQVEPPSKPRGLMSSPASEPSPPAHDLNPVTIDSLDFTTTQPPSQPKQELPTAGRANLELDLSEKAPAKPKLPTEIPDEFPAMTPATGNGATGNAAAAPRQPVETPLDLFEAPAATSPAPARSNPTMDANPFGLEAPAATPSVPAASSRPRENSFPPEQSSLPLADTLELRSTAIPSSTGSGARGYTVEPSDNFWSISRKVYGSGRYFNALAAHNIATVPKPETMKPGTIIEIPPVELLDQKYGLAVARTPPAAETRPGAASPTPKATPVEDGFFVDETGLPMYKISDEDTLSSIARNHLGRASRWIQILELNRDKLQDGNTIAVGTILRLPPDASQVQLMNTTSGSRN